MKKILIIGAIVFVALLSVIAGIVGYLFHNGSQLDASSKQYVDTTIPIIVSSWSKDELLKRSSLQLLEIISKNPEQIDQLFKKLSTLGTLTQYKGSKGEAFMMYFTGTGKSVTAKYVADATFENGDASIEIQLIQNAGDWQFLSFHVNSPIFFQ